jgi:hypothetical protein
MDSGRHRKLVMAVTSRANGNQWTLGIDGMAGTKDVEDDSHEAGLTFVSQLLGLPPADLDITVTRYPVAGQGE